jgi:hypothetical protein
MVEKPPSFNLETALSVVYHFFLAASDIFDLFGPSWFMC